MKTGLRSAVAGASLWVLASLVVTGPALGQGGGNGGAVLRTSVNYGPLTTFQKQITAGDFMMLALESSTGVGSRPVIAFSVLGCNDPTPSHDVSGIDIGLDITDPGNVFVVLDLSGSPLPFGDIAISGVVPPGLVDPASDLVIQGFMTDVMTPPFSIAASNTCRAGASPSSAIFDDLDDAGCTAAAFADTDLDVEYTLGVGASQWTNDFEVTGTTGTGTQASFSVVPAGQGTGSLGEESFIRYRCTNPAGGYYSFGSCGSDFDSVMYATDQQLDPVLWNGDDDSGLYCRDTSARLSNIRLELGDEIYVFVDSESSLPVGTAKLVMSRTAFAIDAVTATVPLGPGGELVTITGRDLQDTSAVLFGTAAGVIQSVSSTTVVVAAPPLGDIPPASILVRASTGEDATVPFTLLSQHVHTRFLLGDDEFARYTTPILTPPVTFQGQSYTDVWVSSNGLATFGFGVTSPSPAIPDFLAGPDGGSPSTPNPAAGYWADFEPRTPDGIAVDVYLSTLTFATSFVWSSMSYYGTGMDAGTFSMTFKPSGEVRFDTGGMLPASPGHVSAAVVGVSSGVGGGGLDVTPTPPDGTGFAGLIPGNPILTGGIAELFPWMNTLSLDEWSATWMTSPVIPPLGTWHVTN